MKRHILATSALPYANGSLHLGHLVETIQTDIWIRFQRSQGHTCTYVCADDAHGTPIMLSAKRQGISPETVIATFKEEHERDFKEFFIDFDCYHSTHSPENKTLLESIFQKAKQAGVIESRPIQQAYCPSCQLFLPDRLIRGTCPFCNAEDQYGDACEKCAKTYDATQLIHPFCVECNTTPIQKSSCHFFFKLAHFGDAIYDWMQDHVPPEVRHKMEEWFKQGLKDWDISRDAPYFGFLIPGSDQYFYVWVDAPIGYIAATQKWATSHGKEGLDLWQKTTNPPIEIHHFIGKDIVYFHTLFWPAILMAADLALPTAIHVHGFLTVNGEKMSKSRGTYITARQYLSHLSPDYFRYYIASKLGPTIEDLDFNSDDFVYKVNADIVNKVVNIASRLGSIVTKKLGGTLSTIDEEGATLLSQLEHALPEIFNQFDTLRYAHALKTIMTLAESVNKYIDDNAPWTVLHTDPERALQVCTTGLNAFKYLMGLLKPILPELAHKSEAFLAIPPLDKDTLSKPLIHHKIQPYQHLATRLDIAQVTAALTLQ